MLNAGLQTLLKFAEGGIQSKGSVKMGNNNFKEAIKDLAEKYKVSEEEIFKILMAPNNEGKALKEQPMGKKGVVKNV